MRLGLGIDTGGTYTDSVIIDLESGEVLCKAKALTTRENLTVGITNSIDRLDHSHFEKIHLVSVSSTLATNSVVEGKGCRVGLIAVGHKLSRVIPVVAEINISGGHTLTGKEQEELDLEAARKFIKQVKNKVDSITISSYLSVRNPSHEIALKSMVEEETSLPVVCGHELTTKLGFNERTLTAVLNARLIPIITDLVEAVKVVLSNRNIKAPVMIVKGDGSIMGEEVAKERPVETILSGPAASLIGAKFLSGLKDAVVIDVGGTTTDIGIIRKGWPRIDSEGALIGGRRTRVRAADITTSGIGGDSRIVIHNGRIKLTPLRVVPLCIGQSLFPMLNSKIEEAIAHSPRYHFPVNELDNVIQNIEFFIFSREVNGLEFSSVEREFLDLIRKEPRTMHEIGEITGKHPMTFNVKRLEELGAIQRIGLTPTDILHADGSYIEYDSEPSKLAVEYYSGPLGLSPSEFCKKVKEAVIDKIAKELLVKLIYEETGETHYCKVTEALIEKFINGKDGLDFTCRLWINKDIIGIGAPVSAYLPGVASKFSTGLVLPEHTEVGNAVGAITGSIVESVEILIRPKPGMAIEEDPSCFLHSQNEMREFESFSEALQYAKEVGTMMVREKAERSGANDIELLVERKDMKAALGEDWGDSLLIESKIFITGIGKPLHFSEGSA